MLSHSPTHARSKSESLDTSSPAVGEEGPLNRVRISESSKLKGEGMAPYGFSFSPAGLLLPYHLGVLEYLMYCGKVTDNTVLAGASAGSIAVVCAALGIPSSEIMKELYKMESKLRRDGAVRKLKKALREPLERILSENCHHILNSRPRPASVVYTNVFPWKACIVSRFYSKADVIECILASCNIPFYFSGHPYCTCRGKNSIDGYFSDRKNFGCPDMPNVKRHIRVLPFSATDVVGHLSPREYIAPNLSDFDDQIGKEAYAEFLNYLKYHPAPLSHEDVLKANVSRLDSMYKGEESPDSPEENRGRFVETIPPTTAGRRCQSLHDRDNEVDQSTPRFASYVAPLGDWVSLKWWISKITPAHPETRQVRPPRDGALPVSSFSWDYLLRYALNPTKDDDALRELYDLGRADAFRWVQLEEKAGIY